MTSADVKFSIDQARAEQRRAGATSTPRSRPWRPRRRARSSSSSSTRGRRSSPTSRSSRTGSCPRTTAARAKTAFYKHPVGTGPFMWDKRVVGTTVTLKRNPNYWQTGKPYLDSVTWTYVPDDNTRELQLGAARPRSTSFPPFTRSAALQTTPRIVTLSLFPSTRTDYLVFNEHVQAVRGRARAPRDLLRDRPQGARQGGAVRQRQAGELVHAAAGAVLRPAARRACSTTSPRPRRSWPSRRSRTASSVQHGRRRRRSRAQRDRQVIQASLKPLGITVQHQAGRPEHGVLADPADEVPARHLVLDDGHRRPGRARDVRGRPEWRARSRSTPATTTRR